MKPLLAFGRFWYDFLVGDSVTLAIGGPLALVAGGAIVRIGPVAVAELAVPLVVATTLVASLGLIERGRSVPPPGG